MKKQKNMINIIFVLDFYKNMYYVRLLQSVGLLPKYIIQ